MIVNNNDNQSPTDYYDLEHNRVTVRGFSYSDNANDAKILIYPSVIENIYSITRDGRIYSIISDSYISWSFRDNLPYVNLSSVRNGICSLEPYYIKDLMAYNYISDACNYLERGYISANIDGNPRNCNYSNIIYIDLSKEYY